MRTNLTKYVQRCRQTSTSIGQQHSNQVITLQVGTRNFPQHPFFGTQVTWERKLQYVALSWWKKSHTWSGIIENEWRSVPSFSTCLQLGTYHYDPWSKRSFQTMKIEHWNEGRAGPHVRDGWYCSVVFSGAITVGILHLVKNYTITTQQIN